MPTLQADDITDLVNSTDQNRGRYKLTELMTDLQEHFAMTRLMRKGRVTLGAGRGIQINTLMNPDTNARNTGLFAVDNVSRTDGSVIGSVPFRHSVGASTFDVIETAMNKSPEAIWDLTAELRAQKLTSLSQLMETNFWGEPSASSDATTPFGLKYWLTYNATEGFNGGNNSNFSGGPGGIDRTSYSRWKNYTFKYTDADSKTDCIRKIRKAMWKTGFKPPAPNMGLKDYNTGNNYEIFTTYDNVSRWEELAENQNDNLGNDLASKDGDVMIRKTPVFAVPYLESNEATSDPIVGINWGVFKIAFLRGREMVHTPFHRAPNQHNVRQDFIDCTYNIVCYDPRRCWLGAKSDWSA